MKDGQRKIWKVDREEAAGRRNTRRAWRPGDEEGGHLTKELEVR